ncbi:MAG TPA: HAD family hydrolase, partial [Bacteroidales bacterium]|nr:HAD family hydrolase [Bacteroidales bacterium]
MKTYSHLFFDLDRTLWDFESNSYEALSDIFEKYVLKNHFSDPRDFIDTYHKHNEKLWAQYRHGTLKKDILRSKRFELTLNERDVRDPVMAQQIGDDYLELSVIKTRLFPYTRDILEYLRPKYKLYILTNGFKETQF